MHIWNASISKIVQYWEDYKSAKGFTLITKISFFLQKSAPLKLTINSKKKIHAMGFEFPRSIFRITALHRHTKGPLMWSLSHYLTLQLL